MHFIALLSLKDGVDQAKIAEALTRRADYDHPAKLVGEYFTPNRKPAVVSIYETDDAGALLMNSMAWLDIFDLEVIPVVPWEEGMQTLST